MKIITNKKVHSILNPHYTIYIISNDGIYMSEFLKNFKITIPYTLLLFNDGESLLEEVEIQKQQNKKNIIIISEFEFESNDRFFNKNGIEIYNTIKKHYIDLEFILLYKKNQKKNINSLSVDNKLHAIFRNNNSHIRVQNLIYNIYNSKNIKVQALVNKKLFTLLFIIIGCILIVFSLLYMLSV